MSHNVIRLRLLNRRNASSGPATIVKRSVGPQYDPFGCVPFDLRSLRVRICMIQSSNINANSYGTAL